MADLIIYSGPQEIRNGGSVSIRVAQRRGQSKSRNDVTLAFAFVPFAALRDTVRFRSS
jgi:hypothetical protein